MRTFLCTPHTRRAAARRHAAPMRRRTLLNATATAALLPLHAARAAPLDLQWRDAARDRALPLRLRLPEGDSACPLVLFSHGLGGSVDAGTQWAEAWAAAGIATLHLQHPGSDREVLREGGLAGLKAAAQGAQLQARVQDLRFVLDELQRRAAEWPRLRLDRVGLAGHSFGAHTALAVAGQRWRGVAPLEDPRPRAFAAFSPSPGPAQGADPQAFGAIRRPLLCLSGSLDGDPLGGGERAESGDWRRAVYDGLPAGDKAELWLDGADHMSFGGQEAGRRLAQLRRPAPARQQAARHRALIEAVSSDWWRAQLLDDSEARRRLSTAPAGLQGRDAWRRA